MRTRSRFGLTTQADPVTLLLARLSTVQFYRLWGVLDYVNQKGYEEADYQKWRLGKREISQAE